MSQLPAPAVRTLRHQSMKNTVERASATLSPLPGPVAVPAPAPVHAEEPRDLNIIGPRKLIRPTLPARALRQYHFTRREESTFSWRTIPSNPTSTPETSHAESFYFQKQMQTQTPMVFVLEDGEKIEGCIEWYDRNAIKVRCTGSSGLRSSGIRGESCTRALIYKSSIKYLYKAGENQVSF